MVCVILAGTTVFFFCKPVREKNVFYADERKKSKKIPFRAAIGCNSSKRIKLSETGKAIPDDSLSGFRTVTGVRKIA